MFYLISGGSASGKSEFAEQIATGCPEPRIYLATMQPFGAEAERRISKHRKMRAQKRFQTEECYSCAAIDSMQLPAESTVLLECLSNLLANELYEVDQNGAEQRILQEIERLLARVKNLILVTNEVFAEIPPEGMEQYLFLLGKLNQQFVEYADWVVEVYYTIPIIHKGRKEGLEIEACRIV